MFLIYRLNKKPKIISITDIMLTQNIVIKITKAKPIQIGRVIIHQDQLITSASLRTNKTIKIKNNSFFI